MNRRQFLKNTGVLTGSTLMSGCQLLPDTKPDNTGHPGWRLGWKNVESDYFKPRKMTLVGKLPQALTGTLYRNGPAKFERNNEQYHHWFDGDGMIQKYTITPDGIAHQGQFIHTEKYLSEQQAQQFLYSGAGTTFANKMPSRNNDTINTANTSLVHWNDEMLALWEGGSAYSIDAETLTTQGLKTWAPELKHMPFSAHPKIDPRGYMWNFGLAPYHNKTGSLIVYKHKKGASKVDYQLVPLPFAGYLHDFAQTASKLIFYISPYRFSHNKGHTYVQRFSWEPELGGRIIVVDKDDLSKKQIFDAPTGFVFHFGQAQQHDKHINLVASWHRTPEIMATGMYDVLTSDEVNYNKSHASVLTINTDTGSVQLSESGHELEFPSFDQYRGGDTVFGVGRKPNSKHHYANSTLAWNSQSGRVDEYFFDDGIIAEEPLYIADTNSSKAGAGWLLQSALNYRDSRTELFVFDAQNIKSGPVAVATMDRSTPLGFHGTFIPV